MTIVIQNGTIIDETGERRASVRVDDGVIADVAEHVDVPAGAEILDAEGAVVCPGLVDIQVHFREPGKEEAETIETGARGAALGGFTGVVAMPNTLPPLDDAAVMAAVLAEGEKAICDVTFAGCITLGRAGEELAPMGELYDLGVRVFTDDGDCVSNAKLMRRAFEYASALQGAVIAQHAEDPNLVAGGHMNEGVMSAQLGIPGRPREAEAIIVARDVILAAALNARYHVLHLSTAEACEIVRVAKARGVRVTTEVSPQHLSLTDEKCATFDPVFKMNPPLRTQRDVEAMRAGLLDGTIDAIATDHAPHAPETKEQPFEQAPPGMLGTETALAVALTNLVQPGLMTLQQVIGKLSWEPCRVYPYLHERGHGRPVAVGEPANLTVFDPNALWRVDAHRMASKSNNSPFAGEVLNGKVRHTILRGEPVVINGEPQR
ncbi:MAG: dihydroorotase [Acidimicrobiia bacterium]